MKITQITIDSVLGVKALDTALHTPVTVFAGDNYAGKSSIREAIKAAFIGMPERVLKKKDFDQLVHDGKKTGSIAVAFDGGEAYFTAPGGEQELKHSHTMDQWAPMALALPYCLDIELFATAKSDERRSLLFAITGASAKTADIVARLKARGLSDEAIETVTPLLRSGFPAAAKFAEERCREAKGAWKSVTNETYGHVKAETWTASLPDVDTTAIEQLQTKAEILKGKIGTEQTRLGAAEQKLKAWAAHTENRANDKQAADRLPALQEKLQREEAEGADWVEKVNDLQAAAGTGPRVGMVHDLARAVGGLVGEEQPLGIDRPSYQTALSALEAYEKQYGEIGTEGDPEAAAKIPDAIEARDLMQRSAMNTKRDIETAKAAAARLEQTVEKGSEAEIDAVRTILAGYQQELQQVSADLQALLADQHAAATAQKATDNARAAHSEAQAWQVAIDALSPDGIPAEILGKALDPFNQTLIDLADTFAWPAVAIDTDMMITAGGRAHALLSQSEKWRTNAIIALAIAHHSGLKIAALDQFDVLSLSGRLDFIDGIDVLAADGFIDTALVFGTFKKLPNFEKFPQITGFWVDSGTIDGQSKQKVAA